MMEEARHMPDAPSTKTYTEDEHIAVLESRVARETADLTATVDSLTTEKADLESKLDVSEAAKVAAEQRAVDAEKAFEDFKTGLEQLATLESAKDARLTELKEVAAHLGPDFFDEEKSATRVQRVIAMDEEAYAAYRDDLKATAPAAGSQGGGAPRETAMQQGGGAQPPATGNAATVFLGRFGASKGA